MSGKDFSRNIKYYANSKNLRRASLFNNLQFARYTEYYTNTNNRFIIHNTLTVDVHLYITETMFFFKII